MTLNYSGRFPPRAKNGGFTCPRGVKNPEMGVKNDPQTPKKVDSKLLRGKEEKKGGGLAFSPYTDALIKIIP